MFACKYEERYDHDCEQYEGVTLRPVNAEEHIEVRREGDERCEQGLAPVEASSPDRGEGDCKMQQRFNQSRTPLHAPECQQCSAIAFPEAKDDSVAYECASHGYCAGDFVALSASAGDDSCDVVSGVGVVGAVGVVSVGLGARDRR